MCYTPYIHNIGGLMRVGFGEAGANVIAKNLAESSGGRLNLMGKVMSCYSVCLCMYICHAYTYILCT